MTDDFCEKQLREEMLSLRKALAQEAVFAMSKELCDRVLELPCYHSCTDVFLYRAVRGEADPSLIALDAQAHGKRVAYPVTGDSGEMEFYYVENEADFVKARFGLYEPDKTKCEQAVVSADKRVVMIVPGVAFGADGRRIGHGGGYYDRYLARCIGGNLTTIGFCYDFQLTDRCPPPKPHDIPVDIII